MSSCEANWDSQIRWTKKDGKVSSSEEYEPDGTIHICPYPEAEKAIHGSHIDNNGIHRAWSDGTCSSDDADENRFTIEFKRPAGNGVTHEYKGNGRVLNEGDGPAFIYGTVTVTAEDGGVNNGDTGAWDAGRLRGPGRGPGGGEEGKGATHDSGTHT